MSLGSMNERILSASEFQKWLTPVEALGRLSDLSSESARQGWIARRLKDRVLRAAARTVVQPDYPVQHFLVLASTDWREWAYAHDDAFWEVGDYAGLATSSTGYGTYMSAKFSAYDVRFDPRIFDERDEERREKNAASWGGILRAIKPTLDNLEAKIAAERLKADPTRPLAGGHNTARQEFFTLPTTPSKTPQHFDVELELAKGRAKARGLQNELSEHVGRNQRKPARIKAPYAARPPVPAGATPKRATKDELRQWFPDYEAVSSDFRFDSVQAAARAHFKPRPVTRKPLREIIGEFDRTRTRGKPTR